MTYVPIAAIEASDQAGYILVWTHKTRPGVGGNGASIMSLSTCKAWCDEMNRKYPELDHFPYWTNPQRLAEDIASGKFKGSIPPSLNEGYILRWFSKATVEGEDGYQRPVDQGNETTIMYLEDCEALCKERNVAHPDRSYSPCWITPAILAQDIARGKLKGD